MNQFMILYDMIVTKNKYILFFKENISKQNFKKVQRAVDSVPGD